MFRYRKLVHVCVFVILVALSFQNQYNPFVMHDPAVLTDYSSQVAKLDDDPLYTEIRQKSSSYSEPPENAVIHDVWKKMPGRNGVKVDVDKSYNQMKEVNKFDDDLLVYEQTPPDRTLEDLPAAPIFRGHPEKKMVSFVVNVSWGTDYIPELLTILKENNVKAAFFIEGKWAKENSEYVEMIHDQDHIIGNHAYDHPAMERMDKREAQDQIEQTNNIIHAITDEMPQWFAPPGGSYNDETIQAADELGMKTVLWTVDTIDWKNPSVSVMMNRVMNKLHPGAIILMHPTSSIADGLDKMINHIRKRDLRIGSLEKMLSEERLLE